MWKRVWISTNELKGGKKSWSVCRCEGKRRRIVRTFPIHPLAQAWAKRYELWLNKAGDMPEGIETLNGPSIPWAEQVKAMLDASGGRSVTKRHYASVLRLFAAEAGITSASTVTATDISRYLAGLSKRASRATVGTYLRVLAWFLKRVRPDLDLKALVKEWHPFRTIKRQRPVVYSETDYRKILGAATPLTKGTRDGLWWWTLLGVLYHCGLRLAEVSHLIWVDVDFERGVLTIQPHPKSPAVFPWRPKGKARRVVPVPADVLTRLARIQERQSEALPYVFLGKDRYDKLQRQGVTEGETILHGVRKGFVAIRTRAGVAEGTIHDWRRTCITNWCRQPELKPREVQLLAGHEDVTTTLAIYDEVQSEEVIEKLKRLQHAPEHISPNSDTRQGQGLAPGD